MDYKLVSFFCDVFETMFSLSVIHLTSLSTWQTAQATVGVRDVAIIATAWDPVIVLLATVLLAANQEKSGLLVNKVGLVG